MRDKVILVGNPNAGKTTLFNFLTKSDERTGNWHGVTVDRKEKLICDTSILLEDLPGTYSLTDFSFEEKITTNEVINSNSSIINLIDLNSLERSLILTLQLLEAGKDFTIVLNKFSNEKLFIDTDRLSSLLKRNVFVFNNDEDFKRGVINSLDKNTNTPHIVYLEYYKHFKYIEDIVCEQAKKINLSPVFCAIKIAENDNEIISRLNIKKEDMLKIKTYIDSKGLTISKVNKLRFEFISDLINKCSYSGEKVVGYGKLDKIFLNNFLSIIIFFIICAVIFYVTFCSFGSFLSDKLSQGVNFLFSKTLVPFLKENFSTIFTSFVLDGIMSGVIMIVSFLPQIVLLYLFLAVLEESGYITRIAYIFEDVFSLIGLSGRSVFTFIMSLGCSTSAILSARTLNNKKAQIKTVMLSPYSICTAKIPILTVICASFFKDNFLFILLFYFVAILIIIFVAFLLNSYKLKIEDNKSILDLPNYNLITFKKLINSTVKNTVSFLSKVASVLVFCLAVIWFLNNFDFALRYVGNNGNLTSIVGFVSVLILPLFAPIGFTSVGIVSSIISGVIAKEIILGSLAMINGFEGAELIDSLTNPLSPVNFNTASAMSFVIFSLFYFPCLSSIVVMKNEIGGKYTFISCIIQFLLTYIICFVVYNSINNYKILLSIILAVVSLIVFRISYSYYKRNSKCNDCKKCKIKCCKN